MNLLLVYNWFHSVIKEVSQANVELFILNLLTEIFLNELKVHSTKFFVSSWATTQWRFHESLS